jgi:hypothetical protein
LLTGHGGIERFFEVLLDAGWRGGYQHPRILIACVSEGMDNLAGKMNAIPLRSV